MMKLNIMKNENTVIYEKENFALMKATKINLKNTKKLEIIGITQENLEEQLIVSAI